MFSISTSQVPPPTDWQGFEHLCWRLWRAVWGDTGAQKNGRQGQPQNGVDVYGQPKTGQWAGVQCKGKDNFQAKKVTERELKLEVEKAKRFRPRLSEFILATTGARDVKIQECARKITDAHRKKRLFSVRVCSWDDIRGLLEEQDQVVEELYAGAAFAKDSQLYINNFLKLLKALEKRQRDSFRKELDAHAQTVVNAAMLLGGLVSEHNEFKNAQLANVSPEQVAEIVAILRGDRCKGPASKTSRPRSPTTVLPTPQTRILGLISVSPIPLSLADFKRIFPEINWDNHIRYFKPRKLIESKDGKYSVPSRLKRSFVKTDEDRLPYLKEWIAALQPLKWHSDTALFLAVQHVSAGHLRDSVCTLVDAAESLLPGHWNETYLSILLKMDDPRFFRHLTNDQRARYFNSVALCLSRAGRHDESVKWFLRLRQFSKRVRNNWGIGQSYHNCGIVYIESGDLPKAEYCFEKAIEHTRNTRDKFLLGRSLCELAMVISSKSYENAEKLLSESEKVKQQVGDEEGLIGVNHGYGLLAVQRGDFQEAIRWFSKAEKTARDIGHFHAQALQRFNIGKAYLDLCKYDESLAHLRQARKMAEKDELSDILVLAVGGEALALEKRGKNHLAEKAFRKLIQLHSDLGDDTNAAIALHDVGAVLMRRKKYEEARKVLSQAAQLARRKMMLDWAYQSQADIATCHVAEGHIGKAISALRRMARNEARRGLYEIAAKLWLDVISYSIKNHYSQARVLDAMGCFLASADQVREAGALKSQVYADLHLWHWENQDYAAGVKALEDMLECAMSAGDDEMACRAQDQIGVCLQELDRFDEAVQAHRKAMQMARRLRDSKAVETSLNNLGEALRKTGRYAEAIRVLEEAEESARDRADHESAISVAHNRALALEHQGKFDDAENVFRECRNEARRRKLSDEYVRALHALANIAWHRGNPGVAERRYEKALQAADKYNTKSRYQICLNYANALRWRKQPERAIEVLASAKSQFGSIPDAHRYHSELATLYDETGNTALAAKHWELAHASANQVNDKYALGLSSGALAEIYDDAGQLEKADKHYQSALEHETDSELRVSLLLQRMRVLLQMKNEKEASKVFDELQRLATGLESADDYVHALVVLGDYNWTEGKSPKEALKAYVAAMVACGNTNMERYFEIGAVITARLCNVEARDKARRITGLKRAIIRWLEQDQGVDLKKRNGGLLLWPFSAALRLVQNGTSSLEFDEADFTEIVENEIELALA